jgi:mono/diheme cytochrome c family protein
MSRIVIPARTRLVCVESRGWLLGKLGFKVLVIAGVVFVWGPLMVGRPHTMSVVGWLIWAAVALLAVGAVVRIAEASWGAGCMAYLLVRSFAEAVAAAGSAIGRGARSLARASRADGCNVCHGPARPGLGQGQIEGLIHPDVRHWIRAGANGSRAPIAPLAADAGKGGTQNFQSGRSETRPS